MGSFASRRTLKKIGKIVAPATAGAERNPVPVDLETAPGFYLGDTVALAAVASLLRQGNQSWRDDPSDVGRILRDIAEVVATVRSEAPHGEKTSKEKLHARMVRERKALATIGWLIVGKSRVEIDDLLR